MKAIAIAARSGHEKALSDRFDLHRLLRTFPEFRAEDGPAIAIEVHSAREAIAAWRDVARRPLEGDEADDE